MNDPKLIIEPTLEYFLNKKNVIFLILDNSKLFIINLYIMLKKKREKQNFAIERDAILTSMRLIMKYIYHILNVKNINDCNLYRAYCFIM